MTGTPAEWETARVGTTVVPEVPAFVGRTGEIDRVRSVVSGARAGRAGALLVSGDAGVGKTRLVEHVIAGPWVDEVVVLAGVCLPMGGTTVPLMPLRTAVRRLPDGIRAPVLADRDGAPTGGPPVVVDEWLDGVCRDHPVVLVVDDIQWADQGSLDVLTYLLAGPADRRLAVLMTLRRGEVGARHPLQRWLADVRRMPVLTELSLGTFDRGATRDQLHALLGGAPSESLVTDVHARTGGNAYLNRLLVEDLTAGTRHLPPGLPRDLLGAVLRPWHRLSERARELVLVLAVGGEVGAGAALRRAADLVGADRGETTRLLREAVDVGVLDVAPDGGYWFHHPLQAEALEASLGGEDRRELHASLARACESDLAADHGPPTAARLAATSAVAEHHWRAAQPAEAFGWTVRAADLADELGDGPSALALVRRLVEADDPGDTTAAPAPAQVPRAALLARLRRTAAGLGDHESEHLAVEGLLACVDEAAEPLLVAELLVRREHLRFSTGRGFFRVDPLVHAATLSSPWPDSWQQGYALAEVAQASLWADLPTAQDAVAEALAHARTHDDPRATAYAYTAAAMGAEFAGRPGAAAWAQRGVAAATQARDWWAFVHAALWEANATAPGGEAWAHCVRRRREEVTALGAPHPYLAWLSGGEATHLLLAGDWRGCTDRLRVALGSDPGVAADVLARLTAARLAVHQGRDVEAREHLARADELFADTSGFLAFEFDAVRAMVRLGAGDPEGAYDAAMVGALSPGVPPTLCEWLCPLAARALADLAEAARESGRPDTTELARVDALVERFPHVIADSTFVSAEYRRGLDALDALYRAEVARARRDPDEAERWRSAADRLDGVRPWDAAYATYRAGEALLLRGEGTREPAVFMLRRAHGLAARLGAEPVLGEVEALARSARVALGDVAPPAEGTATDSRLAALTAREREILGHLVAGRTYGEIARALFVSEKTVSSHVSNLLRKTGTRNRVEVARLARHGAAGAEPTE
jgi:DNA-binding CsgD family transcriptional regulator